MQIAIDGPAGVGKSTTAKKLAEELGFIYLDTGAMYRAIAYKALQNGKKIEEKDPILQKLAQEAEITFNGLKVFLDGEDVSQAIRTPEVSSVVSAVAANKGVREEMVKRQREIAGEENVVMDGRDIGSVVLPDADFKFYLDASPKCRAQRRAKDLGIALDEINKLKKLEEDIIKRDAYDSEREVSPLTVAEGAIYLTTDEMNPDDVLQAMLKLIGE